MAFIWDPVLIINTILCITILVLGCGGFRKNRDVTPVIIGIAFGIFGLSHILTLLGYGKSLESFLIVIRVLAYIIVVFALYRVATKRQ